MLKAIFILLTGSSLLFAQNGRECFTSALLNYPATTAILQKTGKRFSKFEIRKSTQSNYHRFFVRNFFVHEKWDTLTAEKIFSSQEVILWMDSSLVHKFFTKVELDSLISSIRIRLLCSTSSLSADSTKGILELENNYFGLPPDVDGDGILDILFLDIHDNFASSGSFIAGFFDPNDLINNSTSNKRDMLYIDVNPLIKNGNKISFEPAASTIAHEYQHLIEANYERNEPENIFVNEGLSEYAEIFCGFTPRSAADYNKNTDRSLLSWNFDDPLPDYSRASLWTEYLFQRIGYQQIKIFVQSPKVGMDAIKEILSLSDISFKEIFTDWTIANLLNDSSVSVKYYYKHPFRKNFHLTAKYSGDKLPSSNKIILPSSSSFLVQYPYVKELILEPDKLSEQLTFSSLTIYENGTKNYTENLPPTNLSLTAAPNINATMQILIRNIQTTTGNDDNSEITFSYLARGKKSGKITQIFYDDGSADPFFNGARYFLIDSSQAIVVNFILNSLTDLEEISLKGIFLNELEGKHQISNERDLDVQIYSVKNGLPAYAITPRIHHTFNRDFGIIDFEKIPLNKFFTQLGSLRDTICIVVRNDTDDNNLFAISLDNSMASRTLLMSRDTITYSNIWKSFPEIVMGDTNLAHWNAMIRCKLIKPLHYENNIDILPRSDFNSEIISISFTPPYSIDTNYSSAVLITPKGNYVNSSIPNDNLISLKFKYDGLGQYKFVLSLYSSESSEVFDTSFVFEFFPSERYIVGNNYPNPFNGTTFIPITAYSDCNITMRVYNILGQLLVEKNLGLKQTGKYIIPLNVSNFASSVYFLNVIFDDNDSIIKKTRKLLFIK